MALPGINDVLESENTSRGGFNDLNGIKIINETLADADAFDAAYPDAAGIYANLDDGSIFVALGNATIQIDAASVAGAIS